MARFVTNVSDAEESGATSNILNRNLATTAGLCTAGALGGSAVLICATSLPAQFLGTGALAAGLVYFGDKQYKDELKERKAAADKGVADRVEELNALHAEAAT